MKTGCMNLVEHQELIGYLNLTYQDFETQEWLGKELYSAQILDYSICWSIWTWINGIMYFYSEVASSAFPKSELVHEVHTIHERKWPDCCQICQDLMLKPVKELLDWERLRACHELARITFV